MTRRDIAFVVAFLAVVVLGILACEKEDANDRLRFKVQFGLNVNSKPTKEQKMDYRSIDTKLARGTLKTIEMFMTPQIYDAASFMEPAKQLKAWRDLKILAERGEEELVAAYPELLK